jgi:hypothetical protein
MLRFTEQDFMQAARFVAAQMFVEIARSWRVNLLAKGDAQLHLAWAHPMRGGFWQH